MAALAAIFAGQAWAAERRRDWSESARRARAQAELVAVWGDAEEFPSSPQEYVDVVYLRNASPLPAYECVVRSYAYEIPQSCEDGRSFRRFDFGLVPPSTDSLKRYVGFSGPHQLMCVEMQFRDASGQLWHRSRDGALAAGPLPELGENTFADGRWAADPYEL